MADLDASPTAPFRGFPEDGLAFLRELATNNNREWFADNKSRFVNGVREPLKRLVRGVVSTMAQETLPFVDGKPFRIYRDVRFSDDKRPYKTNVGARFLRPGHDDPLMAYVHLEPGSAFFAIGVYRPPVKLLLPIRASICGVPGTWKQAVEATEAAGLSVGSAGSELSGMPRGFAKHGDEDYASFLRWQSVIAQRALSDASLMSAQLPDMIASAAHDASPLVSFIAGAYADADS